MAREAASEKKKYCPVSSPLEGWVGIPHWVWLLVLHPSSESNSIWLAHNKKAEGFGVTPSENAVHLYLAPNPQGLSQTKPKEDIAPVCLFLRPRSCSLSPNYSCGGPELWKGLSPIPPHLQTPESWFKPTAERGWLEDSVNKRASSASSPSIGMLASLMRARTCRLLFNNTKKKFLMGWGRVGVGDKDLDCKGREYAGSSSPCSPAVPCPLAHALAQGLTADGRQMLPASRHYPFPLYISI